MTLKGARPPYVKQPEAGSTRRAHGAAADAVGTRQSQSDKRFRCCTCGLESYICKSLAITGTTLFGHHCPRHEIADNYLRRVHWAGALAPAGPGEPGRRRACADGWHNPIAYSSDMPISQVCVDGSANGLLCNDHTAATCQDTIVTSCCRACCRGTLLRTAEIDLPAILCKGSLTTSRCSANVPKPSRQVMIALMCGWPLSWGHAKRWQHMRGRDHDKRTRLALSLWHLLPIAFRMERYRAQRQMECTWARSWREDGQTKLGPWCLWTFVTNHIQYPFPLST